MKKKPIILICILFTIIYNLQSQINQAQKITYNFDSSVIFPVKRSVIWNLFKNISNWHTFSSQHIKLIRKINTSNDSVREIIFSNDYVRRDSFLQFDPVNRLIVFTFNYGENEKFKNNMIVITMESLNENSSKLFYRIKLEGDKKSIDYTTCLHRLKQELYMYILGINNLILSKRL